MSEHTIVLIWVIKTFFVEFCVFLFLISSASFQVLTISVLYCAHLYMKCSLGISYFLESLVFTILLFSSISLHCSLRKTLSPLAILWNSAFKWAYLYFSLLSFTSLLFSAICKASSDNHFAFLHFFFLELVLITDSCTMTGTSIHSSSGTLSIRYNPLNLFVTSTVY